MKTILIYSLAVIGLISIIKICYDFIKYEYDASKYLKQCNEVKIGMTLKEAKQIMGDYNYYERNNRSEIWTYFNNDSAKIYHLTYPAPFGASTGTDIYFNPTNQIVIEVVCGE